MKNAINYYYNIYPENIYETKHHHYFFIDNVRYTLIKCEEIEEINRIYNMHLNLLNQNIYVHPIILNIENKPLTNINNTPYILLKTLYYDGQINLKNIITFSNTFKIKEKKNWSKIWSSKNDYLEFQIRELGKKHPLIIESFSYYIGLAETAIALINNVKDEEIIYTYAHKRINKKDTVLEFYNPLNITIDTKVRDVVEYLKSSFFSGNDIKEELYYYLNSTHLTQSEIIMFLARMLYPTYYFDLYEEIITNREKDEKLINIIEKNEEYENILKEIYHIVKNYIGNIQIEWLK